MSRAFAIGRDAAEDELLGDGAGSLGAETLVSRGRSLLVDVADTVTEMRKTKHAFDAGIQALKGIDL